MRLYGHARTALYIPWLLVSEFVRAAHQRWKATR